MSSLSDDKALDARIQAIVEARIQAMVMSGAAHLPAAINDGTLLDAKQVRGPVLGNRSDMWLWRRQNDLDPEKKFPDPDMVIAGRRYWYFGTIRTWLAKQAANGKTRGPAAGMAAAVGLILLICGGPLERQILAVWTPPVTRVCDPGRAVPSEVAATSVFPVCRATASGADIRKIETAAAVIEPTPLIAPTHKAPSPIAAPSAKPPDIDATL